MSTTPDEQQRIDAEARELQDLLVRLMLETALRQQPFQDVLGDIRKVIAIADKKDPNRAPSWLGGVEKELREIRTQLAGASAPAEVLQQIPSELIQIKARLTSLEGQIKGGGPSPDSHILTVEEARRIKSQQQPDLRKLREGLDRFYRAAGINTAPVTDPTAQKLLKLVGALPAEEWPAKLQELAAQRVSGSQQPAGGAARPAPGRRDGTIPFLTGIIGLLIGVGLTLFLHLHVPGQTPAGTPLSSASSSDSASNAALPASQPAVAGQGGGPGGMEDSANQGAAQAPQVSPVWTALWSNALQQPAKCAGGRPGEKFGQCACADFKPAAPDAAKPCSFDETEKKWTGEDHLGLAALQAVLIEKKWLGDKADGGLGSVTAGAVKEFHKALVAKDLADKCKPVEEAVGAKWASLETPAEDKDKEKEKEKQALAIANVAAVDLLVQLKQNPLCLPVKAIPPQAAAAASAKGVTASSSHSSSSKKKQGP